MSCALFWWSCRLESRELFMGPRPNSCRGLRVQHLTRKIGFRTGFRIVQLPKRERPWTISALARNPNILRAYKPRNLRGTFHDRAQKPLAPWTSPNNNYELLWHRAITGAEDRGLDLATLGESAARAVFYNFVPRSRIPAAVTRWSSARRVVLGKDHERELLKGCARFIAHMSWQ